jgi:2-keto-3-deoxy-L-rhamnonate aldolase RhmA
VPSSSGSTTDGPPGLRARLERGETLFGTFLNMGSPVSAEICGRAGFDWLLVDLEHGSGSEGDLLHQLQALADTGAHALVRVEANERSRFTKALDLGAEGIMVPRVETAEEAARAAAHMRYPPAGVRGVAFMNRSFGFGTRPRDLEAANGRVVCVVQIESETAVGNVEAIAAVDGVDALFIGPSDLTHSMGILGQTDHPRYAAAVEAVGRAVEAAGKAAGVLLRTPEELDGYRAHGFRLIGISGDGAFLAGAARAALEGLRGR